MGIILRDGLAVRTTVSTVAEAAEVGRRYVRMTLKHVLGARHA
jgi:hypothetical protein